MTKTIERPAIALPPPPEIDDVTRREFLIGVAGLLLLPAGCGGSGEGGEDASGETRTVEHWAGTTEVPAEPARVVVLDSTIAAGLVNLGLTPAGAPDGVDVQLGEVEELLPENLDVDGIELIGNTDEPNLEAIAAISPDLIIGTDYSNEEIYEQLSGIAPTVLVERGGNGGWRQRFLAVAEAVGRSERAEEVEADYEQEISELPEDVRETTVAFIRTDEAGFLIDSTAGAFPGSVAEDAGIPILDAPEGVGEVEPEGGFVRVSGELLDVVADAGLIVVADYRSIGNEESGITEFERNPLWETLPAVQEGRVLQVSALVYNGGNHYSAELLLREIEQALA